MFVVWYVFFGYDYGDYIFVIVMVGYFVIGLDVMFDCQVDFDYFEYVVGQVVVVGDFGLFVFVVFVLFFFMLFQVLMSMFELFGYIVVGGVQFELLGCVQIVQDGVGQFGVVFEIGVVVDFFVYYYGVQMVQVVVFENVVFVFQVFVEFVQCVLFDLFGVFVFFDVVMGEDLNVDYCVFYVGGDVQGGVFYVGCFFVEDCVQ